MTDIFLNYKQGIRELLEQLGKEHPRRAEALTLQARLLENIVQTQQYGDTETRRAERAQIVDALNRLALKAVRVSFIDICEQKYEVPLRPQVPSVLDEVFRELADCVEMMFKDVTVYDTAAYARRVDSATSRLEDLEKLGVESHRIYALERHIEALQHLLKAYRYILGESGAADFYEILAQYLDDAAHRFDETHTRIGEAFSLFMTAWAVIKRTKKLYSDPVKLDVVIERHRQEIPELLLASSRQFREHPMGAFAKGEASYSLGWASVFEALSAPVGLR